VKNRSTRALVTALALAAPSAMAIAGGGIVINEIRTDEPGIDFNEYFELKGPPGTPLDGLTYLVIGDSPAGGSGVVESVVDLTGHSINASGYFLAVTTGFNLPGGPAPDLVMGNINFFENNDNVTHILVSGFTGEDGLDLDLNDDGILDLMPWTEVIDAIGLVKVPNPPPPGEEWVYGEFLGFEDIGPDGGFVPTHVYRCEPDNTWRLGTFTISLDTPGEENPVCPKPAPDGILINEIRIDEPGVDDNEYFELIGPPGASLDGLTYIVIGDSPAGGSGVVEAVVNLNGQSINANGFFLVVESTFTIGNVTPDLILSGNGLNFENNDNVTHVLVRNFTGFNGQDLDTNDDGILDIQPWDEVIDAIGLVAVANPEVPLPPGVEFNYGAFLGFQDIGPDGNFVPAHVYRCEPDGTWQIGRFEFVGLDTPGEINADCLLDSDGDGIPDKFDNCPFLPNPDQADCNNDGIGDACAIADGLEQDCNGNGIPDSCDILFGIENDCNMNGIPDSCDFAMGILTDSNGNGVADQCEIVPPVGVRINEIRIDQPGVDFDEYFELKGAPGTSLTGLRYIVIGDGAPSEGSGIVEAIINLDGLTIPFDGHFLAAETTFSLAPLPLVDLLLDGNLNILNFENGDNVTHLLVANWHGTIGQKLDTNDDGILDVQPWTHVLDAIGLVAVPNPEVPLPPGVEFNYGASLGFEDIGPDGNFVPAHVYRCETTGTWEIGAFDIAESVDTPGSLNPDCEGKKTPCPPDFDESGSVDSADLLVLLSAWGPCPAPCPPDLDGSGSVDSADLLILLSAWGACP
jgi:hypothetical protein